MAERPKWMPTGAEMREVWDRLALREATWGEAYDALSMLTARKIAEWLATFGEADQIGTGDEAYHFYVIQMPLATWEQFIREAKGESE